MNERESEDAHLTLSLSYSCPNTKWLSSGSFFFQKEGKEQNLLPVFFFFLCRHFTFLALGKVTMLKLYSSFFYLLVLIVMSFSWHGLPSRGEWR